jgi:DNA polymerase-3 subunit delta'
MTDKALSLQQIFCQDKAIGSLQRAFAAGKIAHAYIFAGPDGVGRATTARAWAKMLLCENRTRRKTSDGEFVDSCGTCSSCLLFDGGGHPDYVSVYKELISFTKEGKNKKTPVEFPIDVIREFFIEKIASRPHQGQFVVYVVHEAEKLNPYSQNAMLKTLEEPPAFCMIILLCSKIEELLPTILSRCQTLRFGPVDKSHILASLKERGIPEMSAGYWAGFSEGSLGRALDWAALDCDKKSVYDIKKELIVRLGDFQLADTIELAEWLSQSAKQISTAMGKVVGDISTSDLNRRAQKLLVQMVLWAVSDALRWSLGLQQDFVNTDQIAVIQKLSGKLGADRAGELISQMSQKMQWIDDNVNEKLIFEGLLLNLAGLDIMAPTA